MEPTPQQRYFQYLAELEARNPSYSNLLYQQGIPSLVSQQMNADETEQASPSMTPGTGKFGIVDALGFMTLGPIGYGMTRGIGQGIQGLVNTPGPVRSFLAGFGIGPGAMGRSKGYGVDDVNEASVSPDASAGGAAGAAAASAAGANDDASTGGPF